MYVPAYPGLDLADVLRMSPRHKLPFPFNAARCTYAYMARNVIYHLFRALDLDDEQVVLVPDYQSGAEIWAMRAAGATLRFYPLTRRLEPDMDTLAALCTDKVRVLYVIHYFGWSPPIRRLLEFCRRRGILLVEDCALSLYSTNGGQALGSFGDYAIFCPYKSLPLPHGGLLVQNRNIIDALDQLAFTSCSPASLVSRCAGLMTEKLRGRHERLGNVLGSAKRLAGRALDALGIRRLPIGAVQPDFTGAGFTADDMNVGMSSFCHRLLAGFDHETIRQTRRYNFRYLHDLLAGRVMTLRDDLNDDECPLFFPLLVPDKGSTARELRARGVDAIEVWNYGCNATAEQESEQARYLRRHLLELPIHQDISPGQLEYMATQVLATIPASGNP